MLQQVAAEWCVLPAQTCRKSQQPEGMRGQNWIKNRRACLIM